MTQENLQIIEYKNIKKHAIGNFSRHRFHFDKKMVNSTGLTQEEILTKLNLRLDGPNGFEERHGFFMSDCQYELYELGLEQPKTITTGYRYEIDLVGILDFVLLHLADKYNIVPDTSQMPSREMDLASISLFDINSDIELSWYEVVKKHYWVYELIELLVHECHSNTEEAINRLTREIFKAFQDIKESVLLGVSSLAGFESRCFGTTKILANCLYGNQEIALKSGDYIRKLPIQIYTREELFKVKTEGRI